MPTLFVPRETRPGERRVAATPESIKKLVGAGLEVEVARGAGESAGFSDAAFEASGARIVAAVEPAWRAADVIFKVQAPSESEAELPKPGALLFALLDPYRNGALVARLAERRVDAFAMELVPRTTRAQTMDVLSSQASIAGYKAAILAADRLRKHFPLLMTAAGTIQPARVVILGAGVAGLQALATAKRLGAQVEVSDVRPAVKEQVESLGGRFLDLPELPSGEGAGGYARELSAEVLERQRAKLAERIALADVVIATAQVPGKRAPVLVTRAMVEGMRAGSVVIDLAAAQGGNCELTRAGEEIEHRGVRVLGPVELASELASDASLVYSRNLLALLKLCLKDGKVALPAGDDIVEGTLVTRGGEVVHPAIAALVDAPVAS
jgi:NAD(P) transhydrogenase subunit alpha